MAPGPGAASSEAASEAVDFSLTGLEGQALRLSDYRGRWVVVNFWATWCPPCVEELPLLSRFHADLEPRGVTVLGVNFEQIALPELRAFLGDLDVRFPVGQAGGSPLEPFEPLLGLPTTFIVSPGGRLVNRFTGPVTRPWLDGAMRELGVLDR